VLREDHWEAYRWANHVARWRTGQCSGRTTGRPTGELVTLQDGGQGSAQGGPLGGLLVSRSCDKMADRAVFREDHWEAYR
jgi:hypothetical protein